MKAPQFAPGQIEQGIYTWSSRNVTGYRGQGFGAISEGLQSYIDWLESVDVTRFELFAEDLAVAADAYDGWRHHFSCFGRARQDDIGLAYRKMADGGVDTSGRPRYVVHVLFGRSVDLDAFSILATESEVWLTPERCPLDDLPSLSSLSLDNILSNYDLEHDCVEFDAKAESTRNELFRGLESSVGLMVSGAAMFSRIEECLVCLPDAIWPYLEFNSFVGRTEPLGRVGIRFPKVTASLSSNYALMGAIRRTGLAGCVLHSQSRQIWSNRQFDRSSWQSFRTTLEKNTEHFVDVSATEHGPVGKGPSISARGRVEGLQSAKEARVGVPSESPAVPTISGLDLKLGSILRRLRCSSTSRSVVVSEADPLSQEEALQVLDMWSDSGYTRSELLDVPAPKLWAMFRNVGDIDAYSYFQKWLASVDFGLVYRRWRETSLGAFGYTVLCEAVASDRFLDKPLVPRHVELQQVLRLCAEFLRSPVGVGPVGKLIGQGLAEDRDGRYVIRELLLWNAHVIFEDVLPQSDLSDEVMGEIIRDNFVEWCGWLEMPAVYVDAIKSRLLKRRSLLETLWRPRIRESGEPAGIGVEK